MRISTSDPRQTLAQQRKRICTHAATVTMLWRASRRLAARMVHTYTRSTRPQETGAQHAGLLYTTKQGTKHASMIPWLLLLYSICLVHFFSTHSLTLNLLANSLTHVHTYVLTLDSLKAIHPMRATGLLSCCSTPCKFNFAASASRNDCRPCLLPCCPDHPLISLQPRQHRSHLQP